MFRVAALHSQHKELQKPDSTYWKGLRRLFFGNDIDYISQTEGISFIDNADSPMHVLFKALLLKIWNKDRRIDPFRYPSATHWVDQRLFSDEDKHVSDFISEVPFQEALKYVVTKYNACRPHFRRAPSRLIIYTQAKMARHRGDGRHVAKPCGFNTLCFNCAVEELASDKQEKIFIEGTDTDQITSHSSFFATIFPTKR